MRLGQLIDAHPIRALQWRAFVICGAIVLLDGYDLQALGVAAPIIAQRWAIPAASLGWPLAASLVGLGLASVLFAPFGDRLGRRPVLIVGLLCIAASSAATGLARDVGMLILFRFLTGAGLGVCQANATALAAEWAPRAQRASVVTIISCQVAFGALVAGLITPQIMAYWNWQGIFWVGAFGPALLALVVWSTLPESPTYLASSPRRTEQFRRLLETLAPGVDPARIVPDLRATQVPGSLRAVLGAQYRQRTFAFWSVFAIGTFLVYLLISWLPVVLTQVGWSPAASARGLSLYQAGGILGGLILARCIDRGLTFPALLTAYLLAGCTGAAFQYAVTSPAMWPPLLFLLGITVSGALFGTLAVGALLYPPELRATGLGLGAAVARLGATLGPLAGGWVLTRGVTSAQILSWLAAPALLATLAVLYLRAVTSSAPHRRYEQHDG